MCVKGPSSQRQILPDNVKPYHYVVNITPNLTTFEFSGKTDIYLKVVKSTKTIVLNANELKISAAQVKWIHGKTESIENAKTVSCNQELETVSIEFNQEFTSGSELVLSVSFTGIHNDKMAGFYRSGYTASNGEKRYMVVTQFEATDCRRAFPSFDEPNLKATFDITLNVPLDRTALSNMNVISEKQISHNGTALKSITFAKTPIMSTYLVAFAVGELDFVEGISHPKKPVNASPITVRVYTLQGQSDKGKFGLQVAIKTLEYFSEYFDVAYPLPKMDLIAIPDFASGAMENWGLVTYREICLLYDEKTSSASLKQRIAYVVCHELAHQWFGNLVTMDWWSDLWLNEGFATFVGWLAVDQLFPEWQIWTQFVTNDYASGLSLDGLFSSHPIEVDVQSPSEINQIFDAISYSKGASVIRMLNSFLGQTVFMQGVQKYLKKHQYSNATTNDLWDSLSCESQVQVDQLMYSWTRKMGYPVLSIVDESYEQETLTLSLTQCRFISTGETPTDDSTLWWIPLGVVTHLSLDTPQPLIFNEKQGQISFKYSPSESSFYKINYGATGFYRVHYKDSLLKNLATILSKDGSVFGSADKISILTDSLAMAKAGFSSTLGTLDFIKALENEKEYNVLEVVGSILSSILSCFYLETDPSFTKGIHQLKCNIYSPLVKELGYEYPSGENHLTSLARTLAIQQAAYSGDLEVIKELTRRFKEYIQGKESTLHPNLRTIAFTTILMYSQDSKSDFQVIFNLYKNAPSVDSKLAALSSLGAVNDMTCFQKLLEYVLDTSIIKSQDIIYPMAQIGLGPLKQAKLEALWTWVTSNWIVLHDRFKASLSLLGRCLTSAINGRIGLDFINQVEHWAQGKDLSNETDKLARKDQLKTAVRPLEQALEKVKGNTNWVNRDVTIVLNWIKENQLV